MRKCENEEMNKIRGVLPCSACQVVVFARDGVHYIFGCKA